jgi:hypothetical protein
LWVTPFLVSAGVMLLGALIWIFLINPEKSVIDGGIVKSEHASRA